MKLLRTKFLYALVCASLLASLFITQPVYAASFNVSTPAELIAAINTANTNNSDDIITLSANITLTAIDNGQNGLPVILTDGGHSLTIEGGGFTLSRNGAAPDFRILQVGPGANVTINDLTITGGSNAPGAGINMQTGSNLILDHVEVSGNNSSGRAGGVYNYYATLTIQNGSVIGKSGAPNIGCGGAGIFTEGTASASTTLDASTVSYNISSNCAGGGFYILSDAQLVIRNGSVVSNNIGGDPGDYPPFTDPAGGGGIFGSASPIITISDSTVSNNTVNCAGNPNCGGGGIQGASSVTITNSTFSNNTVNCNTSTPCGGGGIYNYATLTITNSTFSGNSTASDGGGIYNHATLTITNSTFSGNSAAYGGGINNQSSLTFTNSTLSGNTATGSGGGIYNNNVVNYNNTIIANSSSGGDCYNVGTIGINLNSLVEDGSCSASLSGDPNLGSLANNGGPTQTHALLTGSPAIDTGVNCPATDQRGVTRPKDIACDIGAYEYFALGNLVWGDLDNDGLLNGAEVGTDGVTVELWSGDGNTLLDTTTTSGGGIYTLNIPSAGDYIVRLPAVNFNPGGILRGYRSSTGQIPTLAYEPAPDPDTNTTDSDDNGTETNGLLGLGGYIQTLPITVTSSTSTTVDFGVNNSPQIDLVVTKTDNQSSYTAGGTLNYVIVVTNHGPADANGMTVSDARPSQITSWTWACASGTPSAYNCTDDASNPATFTDTLDLPQLASVTYNVTAQVAPTATGTLSNMVVVIPPSGMTDMTPRDNFVTDTDTYASLSTTFKSIGSQDGWILESSETSGRGGTLNANSNLLYVGDDAQDKQYRSFLTFNTAGLPDNAVITKVKLRIKIEGFEGGHIFTPAKTHGNLLIDLRVPFFKSFFGYSTGLYAPDFQSTEGQNTIGVLKSVPSTGWYTIVLKPTVYSKIDLKGKTQFFRLRFQKDDNDDLGADYLKIYSGNASPANRPQLIVEYSVP